MDGYLAEVTLHELARASLRRLGLDEEVHGVVRVPKQVSVAPVTIGWVARVLHRERDLERLGGGGDPQTQEELSVPPDGRAQRRTMEHDHLDQPRPTVEGRERIGRELQPALPPQERASPPNPLQLGVVPAVDLDAQHPNAGTHRLDAADDRVQALAVQRPQEKILRG
ncbi:MAG: hypothetical protein LDL56_12160, partial [Armatimonadetes bacterium]|nr:hypothetical protein [Armatimonadota bacterium]